LIHRETMQGGILRPKPSALKSRVSPSRSFPSMGPRCGLFPSRVTSHEEARPSRHLRQPPDESRDQIPCCQLGRVDFNVPTAPRSQPARNRSRFPQECKKQSNTLPVCSASDVLSLLPRGCSRDHGTPRDLPCPLISGIRRLSKNSLTFSTSSLSTC